MKPVSIIIPTLNEERYLPRLLDSIFCNAIGSVVQIIIVDGGSTDATLDVVRRYTNDAPTGATIQLFCTNLRNIALQRNLGAEHALHDLLIFFDADVRIPLGHTIAQFIELFETRGCVCASCWFTSIESDWKGKFTYYFWTQFTRLMQYYSPNVLGACIITTRSIFQRCKGFDATITIGEDANFCFRSMQFGRFRILPVVIEVSARRFRKHGYCVMWFEYIKIFLIRTVYGEYRIPSSQRYGFGDYADP